MNLQKKLLFLNVRKNYKKNYKKNPILQIKNLKTYFPVRNGFFGGVTSHVKAVDDVSLMYTLEKLWFSWRKWLWKQQLGEQLYN